MYKKGGKLRRSSRRSQLSLQPGRYKEMEGSDLEDGEIPGKPSHSKGPSKITKASATTNEAGLDRTTSDSSSRTTYHNNHRFTWSLQSEVVVNRMKDLFRGEGLSGGDSLDGAPYLATDVTLVSEEGDCVPVHKMVLVLCCPYFWNLFAKIPTPVEKDSARNTLVVMGNMKTTCLKALVRFIYTGAADVTSEGESEFLEMGEFLGISGIKNDKGTTRPPAKSSVQNCCSGGGVEAEENNSVIKVHVIDKRNADNLSKPLDEDNQTKEIISEPVDEVPVCKVEPLTEEFNQLEDGFDDNDSRWDSIENPCSPVHQKDSKSFTVTPKSTTPEANDASDFSDDNNQNEPDDSYSAEEHGNDDEDFVPSVGRKRKISGKKPEGKSALGRRPKWDWHQIEPLTDDQIAKNWRILSHHEGVNYRSWVYYCSYGDVRKMCKARVRRVVDDGETTFYTNNVKHSNHRTVMYGLPKETKQFIITMLEKGTRRPEKILKAMRLNKMKVSSKKQVENFIMYTVKKSGKVFPFPKSLSSPKSRPVKKITSSPKVGDGPRRKPGRPFKDPDHSNKSGGTPSSSSGEQLPGQISSDILVGGPSTKS